MPVISIRVGDRVYEELRRRAQARGVSLYEYVRSLIEDSAKPENGYAGSGTDSQAGMGLGVLLGRLEEVVAKLEGIEERLARVERSLPPVPRAPPDGRPSIPEPTPEVLRRIAAKLEQRETWPDEYPGNLTAGEILLLDRLVSEGRAYYDRFSVDGGSLPFTFVHFTAPHHLPLNGSSIRQPPATGAHPPQSPRASSSSLHRRRLHDSPPRLAHRVHPYSILSFYRKLYKLFCSNLVGCL